MKYKHKFYLLILIAVIYNLFQMMKDHESPLSELDPDLNKNESVIGLEQCGIICPDQYYAGHYIQTSKPLSKKP